MANDKSKMSSMHLSVEIEDHDRLDRLAERLRLNKSKTATIAFKLLEQYLDAGADTSNVILTLLPIR